MGENSEATSTNGSNDQARPTHGTVNVLLANRNGLVVVTDSRLSNGQRAVGNGQKLFQIDNRTVCTIAGWYSSPGPVVRSDVPGHPDYPAELAVPDIIQIIISRIARSRPGWLTIDRKMEVISKIFALSLLVVANLYDAAGVPLSHEQLNGTSEITVAGYDDKGVLEILQTDIVPIIQNGKIMDYNMEAKPTIYVPETSGVVPVIRGIQSTAHSILDGSYPAMASDPILGHFKAPLADDKGRSLSMQDMEQIAKQIERCTALQFPTYVGGSQQIAELSSGVVSQFVQPISSPTPIPRVVFETLEDLAIVGTGPTSSILVYAGAPKAEFVQRAKLANGMQYLDNFFFFKSDFAHVHFIYLGSPRSIFDKSNTLTDCTLTLAFGADANSNFVKQIKTDFPALKIIDQTAASFK